jgi:tetratricopeptide (TPR) repeat protein
MIKEQSTRLVLAGAFILSLASAPALAADPSQGGGSGDATQCKEGLTYNEQTKTCEKTSLLDDQQLYEQGRALALAGYYENALEALTAVRNKEDARVLTYIGYANRKMGAVDEGIAWYHKALAIDPGNLYTHEYLGEGYVAAGEMDLAKVQLAKLETLCGTSCEQYEDLAAAIAGEPENWGGL